MTTVFEPTLGWVNAAPYDVSADGRRFPVPMPPEDEAQIPLSIVQNWTRG